jgi:L-seryl-tRNA(Ser) seleniumtransferase
MRLPSILKDLVPTESVKQWMDLVSQPNLVAGLKEAAQQLGWKESWAGSQLQHSVVQAKRWLEMFQDRWREGNQCRLQLGINATGILFSSRWSTIPLASSAISMQAYIASGFSRPDSLALELERSVLELTGAEACAVFPSIELAILLAGQFMPADRRWAVPRSDCIRLSGGADLAALLSHQRSPVLEMGATNSCTQADFEAALESQAQGFLIVSPNRLPSAIPLAGLRPTLSKRTLSQEPVLLVELSLDGSFIDLAPLGVPFSNVADRLRDGVDAIIVPGNGWIGGPESGLIVGKASFVNRVRELASRLGIRANPHLLATLSAVISAGKDLAAWKETPLGAIASNGIENLVHRGKRLAMQLDGIEGILSAESSREEIPIADSPIDSLTLETGIVRVAFHSVSPQEIQSKLIARETPIWCNTDERCLSLVMRSIDPADDNEIVLAFESLLSSRS